METPSYYSMIIACSNSDGIQVVPFDELQKRFPHTSFCNPITQSSLPEGYFLIEADEQPITTRKLKEKIVPNENGLYKVVWEFANSEDEDRELVVEHIYNEIERLTKETDWAVREGVPGYISDKYKEYRIKLWNIPNQQGFPFNVEFPEIK